MWVTEKKIQVVNKQEKMLRFTLNRASQSGKALFTSQIGNIFKV